MHLYAAANGAVLSVTGTLDNPQTNSLDDLQTTRRLDEHRIECIAADPREPHRAFCGTFDAGLFRTRDGGDTWHSVGEDTVLESVTSLAISPTDPDVVYTGSEPSAVFRSVDGGETWTELPPLSDLESSSMWAFPPRPHTHHARWIEMDPTDPDRLFVAIEAGALVRSLDGGETWQDRVPSSKRDVHSMTTHPDKPGHVWVAAGDGYAESNDGGKTWTTPTEGLGHGYCWSVVVDSGDPDSALVTAASSAMRAHSVETAETFLYRRHDDEPWERLDETGLPTGTGVTRAVLAAGQAAGECYAVNDRGLYRTTDFGDSWSRLDIPWPGERQTASGLAVVE
ncbi:hypothetical protein E6P09_04890 [Haloferax mediterranei ATCC 33500]|uniref:BNR repeat-containing protein n=1 Tax=Haloferax mediterranei (strain ATCC 33500 / DSM 1411 / JCM 8866 / NBRC 14739 / NCIMB 2177 / R-4) TaxID=523841 RepID=I3R1I9_HALMT|nr:hypothetical protein [Haloferax mediterranei]AFK18099.1 hypothetical protein HFX_0363 [Haloferax mediterranei ATCC 33500]AHZ22493.1 hypothetical protein BM92_07445 [Haloferax mediterranei ATCC 33500]EMA02628.1 hypothetical protein C439_08595 [Haloferax mediterranei ATCC 33500]MDX5988189.1 hypothetical protein [Haloferax mediterranei ATCC 33500]QCQ74634.1 hypothetical protein E6P09_04890 [Haloferax mediterranei ATCC 33500]